MSTHPDSPHHNEVLGNIFGSIEDFFVKVGLPLTDEQVAALALVRIPIEAPKADAT